MTKRTEGASLADFAVSGLHVVTGRGVVKVFDGQTTWLCRGDVWDAALATLDALPWIEAPEVEAEEAYQKLYALIGEPIAVAGGGAAIVDDERRAARAALVKDAVLAGLVDADLAFAMFGVGLAEMGLNDGHSLGEVKR